MTAFVLVHRGHVSESGKLTLDDREGFLRAMHGYAGLEVEVVVRKPKRQRSNQANKWYWGCILAMIGDYCGYEPEEAHQAMKWLFLRRPADVDGAPDTVRSTAILSTDEFSEYCEQIRRWAALELGINIPDPGRVEAA